LVNRKTYDLELLNTSGIYIIKKELRNQPTEYYTFIETLQQFVREMNSDSQQLIQNENLNLHAS
jgi:hypothetical protein